MNITSLNDREYALRLIDMLNGEQANTLRETHLTTTPVTDETVHALINSAEAMIKQSTHNIAARDAQILELTKSRSALLDVQDFLYCLQNAGVDNWDGYEYAQEEYRLTHDGEIYS